MLILLGIILDGVVTLALGVLIATTWKVSSIFFVSLAALHGLVAGLGILLFVAVKGLEQASPALPTDQARREPEVIPFPQTKLDRAA
jgi:hypothetical protein